FSTVTWTYNLSTDLQTAISNLGTTVPRKDYWFVTYAYDLALNKEFGPISGEPQNSDIPLGAGKIVQFDNQKPIAITTEPVGISYKNSAPMLYGVVTDTGVITKVHILVKARGTYNAVWKGTYLNSSADWDVSGDKYAYWSTPTYNNGQWSISLPSLSPVNNSKISVWARGIDKAGNWEDTPTNSQIDNNKEADDSDAYYFTFDNAIPVTQVTVPESYATAYSTGLLKGTAFDPTAGGEPSGLKDLWVRYKRSDNLYWNFFNSDWSANQGDYYAANGTIAWDRPIGLASQEDGYQYNIYTHARDNALNNNNAAYFSTFTFLVDMTTPTSKVSFPANNAFIGSAVAIDGTADDSVENIQGWSAPRNFESGISTSAANAVETALQRLSDGKWWDGTNFNSGTRIWSSGTYTGASSGTWSYSLPSWAIADGTTYYAMSRVKDIAGNIQTEYTTNFFTGDTTPPTSKASFPEGGSIVESVNQIKGTAQDNSPGELRTSAVVAIALRKTTGLACYNGTAFTTCPGGAYPDDRIWITTGTCSNPTGQPAEWIWDTSLVSWINDADYDVQARAIDKAGNMAAAPGSGSPDIAFTFTTPAAVPTITKPANDWGNYRNLGLGSIEGGGTNLRVANSVEVHIKRLKEPTSWWYEPNTYWVNTDTYVFVSKSGATWSLGISAPSLTYAVDNASYSITVIGWNPANQSGSPVVRTFIADNTLP
ncbi:MAG: hypothetical protein HY746_01070, partial [Elusimicrobia bacterium]|nr:hypothetical protein [Elusimicrobiota bacterium]